MDSKMDSKSIPALLVTANVGSIFEDPDELLRIWSEEFLSTVARLDPKFVALHCQEVGGKNYEKSMKHVEHFVNLLMSSNELRLFDKVRVFLDEDYSSAEHFTALGNLYFVHESIEDVMIYDFKEAKYVKVQGKEIHSGNIESVITKEKAKFPQEFFPECKWSRKGFLRTRWFLSGTVFDMVNIHLFHDASNVVAMEASPSVYSRNRHRALEYTLQRFHNDSYGTAPYFIFGDFNFRTDVNSVIKKLTDGLTTTRVHNNKNGEYTKLQYTDDKSELILTVGKKEFHHSDHQTIFLNNYWLKEYDKEMKSFENHLTEFDVTFPPTYPFEEKITEGARYMFTRCPSWCDRILLSHTAKQLVCQNNKVDYGFIGGNTCMGDHKPVYLRVDLMGSAGTIKCCKHAQYECLPILCNCCLLYASVTINVTDLSDYLVNARKSFDCITLDSNFLHEPITKDMLMHEPYTPESAESHSPSKDEATLDDSATPNGGNKGKHNCVSPLELKTKLEDILRVENARSQRFLMKRSTSQGITQSDGLRVGSYRDRAMSEVCKKCPLKSHISFASLNNRSLSSDEEWGESKREDAEAKLNKGGKHLRGTTTTSDLVEGEVTKHRQAKGGVRKRESMKKKFACCSIF